MPTAFPLSADPFSSGSAAAALAPEPNPLGDRGDRMKELNAKIDSETVAHEATVAKERAENQRIEGDFFTKNAPPVYKPPAPYNAPKETSPIEMWGSLAMMFGMLASHFTRTPMITAMNAGSAVMNAFKQKDVDYKMIEADVLRLRKERPTTTLRQLHLENPQWSKFAIWAACTGYTWPHLPGAIVSGRKCTKKGWREGEKTRQPKNVQVQTISEG